MDWIRMKSLVRNGVALVHPFGYHCLSSLLCCVSAHTLNEFKCYKSVEAFKQVNAGHLSGMEVIKQEENVVVRAEVS